MKYLSFGTQCLCAISLVLGAFSPALGEEDPTKKPVKFKYELLPIEVSCLPELEPDDELILMPMPDHNPRHPNGSGNPDPKCEDSGGSRVVADCVGHGGGTISINGRALCWTQTDGPRIPLESVKSSRCTDDGNSVVALKGRYACVVTPAQVKAETSLKRSITTTKTLRSDGAATFTPKGKP